MTTWVNIQIIKVIIYILIEFDNGCRLDDNSISFVYQALANTAGKNKLSINSKIKWASEFINEFNNYDISYLLNNYGNIDKLKKLLNDIKNGNRKVNFFLLIFVMEADVQRKRLNNYLKIKNTAQKLNFKNKLTNIIIKNYFKNIKIIFKKKKKMVII